MWATARRRPLDIESLNVSTEDDLMADVAKAPGGEEIPVPFEKGVV